MSGYVHMYGARQVGPAPQPDEDAFMVPGMGAQPVPVKEWVPANDNEAPVCRGLSLAGSQYIGLTRAGDPNGCADDLVVRQEYRAGVDTIWSDADEVAVTVSIPVGISVTPQGSEVVYALAPRKGDWIQTYTGKTFHPMDPRSQDVDIRDIAHALSMQCRYAGHCRRFYSVAEHSVLIARWLVGKNKPAAIYGLLHDASEAYLCDVPRPVKPFLTGYQAAESKVQAAVWARFGLYAAVPAIAKEADDRILADELVNMTRMSWHARHADPLGVPMMYWSPAEAEREFLATYTALTGEVV